MPSFKATLLFFCTFLSVQAISQNAKNEKLPDTPLRIEIPVKSDRETYRVLACDSIGMLLFFKSTEQSEENKIKWYFLFYDLNFQVSWTKAVLLDENMEYRFSDYQKDTAIFLFGQAGKKKSNGPGYQILRAMLISGTFILNQGALPENSEPGFFSAAALQAWVGLQSKNEPGKLLSLNLKTGNRRIFQLGEGKQISLHWLFADSTGQFARAIVSRQVSKKTWEYFLVHYDSTGKILREVPLENMPSGRNYTGFQWYQENERELVVGTYGLAGNDESSGLFTDNISPGVKRTTNFYHFLDLKHAGNFLSEKDIISLKKKALKKNKTRGEYPLDFTLLLHKIFTLKNEIILCGEIFNPQYHSESFTDFDFYGRPYSNSYSVFDGYRFSNALIAGFSQDGQLLWDNTLDIRNLVSFELTTKVCVFPSGENLVLCYLSDGRIGYNIIHGRDVIEKTDFIPVEMLHAGDKLLSETRSRMIPWYGHYFLCSGYQEIKNVALDNNNKRLVFYINKIRFEE